MSTALKVQKPADTADRPGWIPRDILHDWDTCPYAYQTEEELMPAGGLHGKILAYFIETLMSFLEARGKLLLVDVFMLYRDSGGTKRRVAPDFLLMPFRADPPSAYDLDAEPPPEAVVEITSPDSRMNDMGKKVSLYTKLGVRACLVIDAAGDGEEIGLHLWRKIRGQMLRVFPDAEGRLTIPEMRVSVRPRGRELVFTSTETGGVLRKTESERQRADIAEKMADQTRSALKSEQQRADSERQRADMADKKADQTRKEIAENLLRMGTDVSVITQATGLSEEEINRLPAAGK